MEDVMELLKDKWGLGEFPKLLISVIGGTTALSLTKSLENAICGGLIKVYNLFLLESELISF